MEDDVNDRAEKGSAADIDGTVPCSRALLRSRVHLLPTGPKVICLMSARRLPLT